MKLLIHSQTSTAPLKFGNGKVISSHVLQWLWFLIHARLNFKRWRVKKAAWWCISTHCWNAIVVTINLQCTGTWALTSLTNIWGTRLIVNTNNTIPIHPKFGVMTLVSNKKQWLRMALINSEFLGRTPGWCSLLITCSHITWQTYPVLKPQYNWSFCPQAQAISKYMKTDVCYP